MIYLAVFRSRNQALRFGQLLSAHGCSCRTVPTPEVLNMGCGLCVEFDPPALAAARRLLASNCFSAFAGWFKCVDGVITVV